MVAPRTVSFGILLVITGVIGWASSFALTLDKIAVLENPDAALSCSFSVLIDCGVNLQSWQGEVFGFPNPLVGLAAFVVPILLGVALLGGVRFPRWFWHGFLVGVTLGIAWVVWFIVQSIYVLGTLCPWCMTMWVAMIPMFWASVSYVFGSPSSYFPPRVRAFFANAYSWVWLVVLASYVVVALLAQLRLDWLGSEFGL